MRTPAPPSIDAPRPRPGARRQAPAGQARAATPSRLVALLGMCLAAGLAACTPTVVDGEATSGLNDPLRVGGPPVHDGPSGPRPGAPEPSGRITNTDRGEVDELALLAVNDIEEFWEQAYGPPLEGRFTPVSELVSYDSRDPDSPRICRAETFDMPNAFYCPRDSIIAWDRGVLAPIGREYFGDMSVAALLAHEYGHAVQHMGELVGNRTPTIVREQQADCFAGAYARYVAEGRSPRFTLSTGDALSRVLAAAITIRDPILTPDDTEMIEEGHGTAFERVGAFQMGFVTGVSACAAIDMDDIEDRRGDLPLALEVDTSTGDLQTGHLPITQRSLTWLTETLTAAFGLDEEPALSFSPEPCPDAAPTPPASYCPATDTISVDVPTLRKMGNPADEVSSEVLLQGDNTAYSVVMSRLALALQHHEGLDLDSTTAALRTACLTGVAHRLLAEPADDQTSVSLTAGDLDEAVAGLLTNGLAASDVNGDTAPAGFARIYGFRAGVLGDEDECYQRYP